MLIKPYIGPLLPAWIWRIRAHIPVLFLSYPIYMEAKWLQNQTEARTHGLHPDMNYKGSSWGNGGTDQYYYYPNQQEAATLWWHDHALGATRLNVYAGLAGYYFLKGADEENAKLPGWSDDDLVQEVAPSGTSGTFNPNPYLPEIEIAFQDRMFDTYGKLYFPNLPTNPEMHPFWTPEFVGNVITVNGKTWPYLSVAPRKYRFRLLNGSNARFYEIWLQDLARAKRGPSISADRNRRRVIGFTCDYSRETSIGTR